MTLVPFAKAWL